MWYCSDVCRKMMDYDNHDDMQEYVEEVLWRGLLHEAFRDAEREGDGMAMLAHWRIYMPDLWNRKHNKYLWAAHHFLAGKNAKFLHECVVPSYSVNVLSEGVRHFRSVVGDAGSRKTTAHAHQCCIFQGYPKAVPSWMKLTMCEPASMTTDKGARRVTSYFYSALVYYQLYVIQWNLFITRSLGPWKLPCYIRFLIISG